MNVQMNEEQMTPSVSVLIPVYGVENFIEKCLVSLFQNTVSDKCEFILVNDCTKDNSIKIAGEVIARYTNLNIKILNHDKNKGIAAVRNTALLNASGKYIVFADSDDWVESDYIEKLLSEAEKTDADICCCYWYEEKENKSILIEQDFSENQKENFENLLKSKIHANLWNKLIKHTLYTENNINFEEGINNWEDETICLKLFSVAERFACVNAPLYHYRIRYDSYIHCLITDKTKDDFLNAILAMEVYLSDERFFEYKDLLNYKKIHIKQKLLMDGTRAMQKKYISIWSEGFPFIKQDSTLNKRVRLILTTAKTAPFISLCLLFCLSALKIILRKQFTWKQYLAK